MQPQAQFDRILSICKLFSPIVFNSLGNLPHPGPIPTRSDIEIIALSLFQISWLPFKSKALSFYSEPYNRSNSIYCFTFCSISISFLSLYIRAKSSAVRPSASVSFKSTPGASSSSCATSRNPHDTARIRGVIPW